MRKVMITIIATAATTAGFALNAASAAPGVFFKSTASMTSGESSTSRASATVDGMLTRFIRFEAEANAGTETCTKSKDETKVAEATKDEVADKKTPQGPEPIYFAF